GLATFVAPGPGERTTRYRHRAAGRWRMGPGELAVLAVLLLHGVQSVSQVRDRARRLARFTDPAEVDAVLDALAARTPTPFAARAPGAGSGAGGAHWAQVLTGPPPAPETLREDPDAVPGGSPSPSAPRAPSPSYADLAARLARVEQRLAAALDPATAPAEREPSDPAPAPRSPATGRSGDNQLAERVGDIERRLARIEAELAALR
ncbi:MAG TPA: DUF480 domain-containing protein, partial [Acidimicrobiales bacterium]|nr:DUF480 domain-containing protein [Acidimicrobiales bacterium]